MVNLKAEADVFASGKPVKKDEVIRFLNAVSVCFQNLAEMRSYTPEGNVSRLGILLGKEQEFDGGEGIYIYLPNSYAADDGVSYIRPDSITSGLTPGRWHEFLKHSAILRKIESDNIKLTGANLFIELRQTGGPDDGKASRLINNGKGVALISIKDDPNDPAIQIGYEAIRDGFDWAQHSFKIKGVDALNISEDRVISSKEIVAQQGVNITPTAFTPALSFSGGGSITYNASNGRIGFYLKSGVIWIQFYIHVTALSGASGDLRLTGLHFDALLGTATGSVARYVIAGTPTHYGILTVTDQNYVEFAKLTGAKVKASDLASSFILSGQFSYFPTGDLLI